MIPLNRLMIETDAPFLTPRDSKEKSTDGRNEPAFLPHILQTVARCIGTQKRLLKQQRRQRRSFSAFDFGGTLESDVIRKRVPGVWWSVHTGVS